MKKLMLVGVMLAGLSGCSSIVSKSDYSVAIASNPETADFTVVNRAGKVVHSGVTPATVMLKSSSGYFKGETYTITFKKEGYPDKVYTMKSGIDGWYFGNILIGGLIGILIVDPATGAMYSLPERVDVALDGAPADKEQVTIASIHNLSDDQKAQLVRIN
ncbi:hypothetical protein [Shewanella sp. KCT]|uniref:hypothetical protein n=1 Tax=Shewanella sp. KCT TaxID=2569535 RepID=UPI00118219CF|nr:hypothetical protein [Shewanella sp. KCT]TVP11805.1 hypothetical protein AYI87_15360 [Shewanella sp. KCT]